MRCDLACETREVDEDNRTIEFVISSFRKDDFGTRFDPNGADLSQYRKNPIVLWRHMRDTGEFSLPIGKGLVDTFRIEGDKMFMTAQFTSEEEFWFGFQVYKLIKSGYLNMASIGAQVLEEEIVNEPNGMKTCIFRKWKLFEWSVVPIGANDDALVAVRELEEKYDVHGEGLEKPKKREIGVTVVRDNVGKGIVTIEEAMDTGKITTHCIPDVEIPESDEQRKHREYFAQWSGVAKHYRNLLEKLYRRAGLVAPGDESEAVRRIEELVLSPKAEEAIMRSTPASETRGPDGKEIKGLAMKLIERVEERKREALRAGVPLSRIRALLPDWSREEAERIS